MVRLFGPRRRNGEIYAEDVELCVLIFENFRYFLPQLLHQMPRELTVA